MSRIIEEKIIKNSINKINNFLKIIKVSFNTQPTFKNFQGNFKKFQNSILTALLDKLSYFNMYTLMKKIIKYLVDADEFSYIHKKNENWEKNSQ